MYISEVNSMTDDQFEWVFGNVIELCSEAAVVTKKVRPFKTISDLCAAFYKYLDELSAEEKLVILKLHPDLAGRLGAQGELTSESANEQRIAGLENLTADQKSSIDFRNQRYKEKFGFPFIICARQNKVNSILEGLESRFHNTWEQEIEIGINEVKKICQLRILDIVKD